MLLIQVTTVGKELKPAIAWCFSTPAALVEPDQLQLSLCIFPLSGVPFPPAMFALYPGQQYLSVRDIQAIYFIMHAIAPRYINWHLHTLVL